MDNCGIWYRIVCRANNMDPRLEQTPGIREPEVEYCPTGYPKTGELGEQGQAHGGQIDWFTTRLGENIRERRQAMNMTQDQLAQIIQCDRGKISRVENGGMDLKGQELNVYCKALHCWITDLWPDQSVIDRHSGSNKRIRVAAQQILEELDEELEGE